MPHKVDIVGHLIYHIQMASYEFSHVLLVAKFAYNYHSLSETKPQTEMLVKYKPTKCTFVELIF